MMKILVALLLSTSPVLAQGYVGAPPFSWCYDGVWWASRPDGSCHPEDKGKTPVFALSTNGPPSVIGNPNLSVSAKTPKCREGYSLVYDGRPMCARDLVEPE